MDYFPTQKDSSLVPIRTSGERFFYNVILKLAPTCTFGADPISGCSFENARIRCLSEYLRLSEKSVPELHQAMCRALENLGRGGLPYDLFQVQGEENASTTPFESHPLVTLQGRMLTLLDNDSLCALLGHELGHCFLHSSQDSQTLMPWLMASLARVNGIYKPDASEREIEKFRSAISAFFQCREISADRAELLASRDLNAALRLEMITMTGLSHQDIHWDIEEFLAQSELCVDDIRKNGCELSTHPGAGFRAWALAQFAKTDTYCSFAGGEPTLKQEELDAEIIRMLSKMRSDAPELEDEQPSVEIWLFSLSACFLLSWIDGDFCDAEADWLERVFSPHVPDYKFYLNYKTACKTIGELSPYLRTCSISRKIEVFMMLVQVMMADGIIHPKEIAFIKMIGKHIDCEDLWNTLLEKIYHVLTADEASGDTELWDDVAAYVDLPDEEDDAEDGDIRYNIIISNAESDRSGEINRDYGYIIFSDAESERVADRDRDMGEHRSRPQVTRQTIKEEADQAFGLYCNNVRRRGVSRTTLARLLRLIGIHSSEFKSHLQRLSDLFRAEQIVVEPALDDNVHLQTVLTLTPQRVIPSDQASKADKLSDDVAAEIVSALTKLQAAQISGNGHSPSVRCREERPGRLFDLTRLNQIAPGRTERCMIAMDGGSECVLISTQEAAQNRVGRDISLALEKLAREARLRADEQGTSDLCAGSCFISGIVKGYLVCAPLMLHNIELKRAEGAVSGWKACPVKGESAKVNHAVLRLIANKLSAPYHEAMMEKLDDAAANGEEALIRCVTELGFFIGKRGGEQTTSDEMSLENLTEPLSEEIPNNCTEIVNDPEIVEDHSQTQEDTTTMDALYPLSKCTPVTDFSAKNSWLCLESCAMLGIFPQSSSETLREYNELISELQSSSKGIADIFGSAEYLLPGHLIRHSRESQAPAPQVSSNVPLVSLDPSQMEALDAARTEKALVIDGPPGTGKSQVIVGIVLDALMRGLRVAVVSDKRAALDVVAQRLSANGFEDIYGIIHDVYKDRNELFARIADRMKKAGCEAESLVDEATYQSQADIYHKMTHALEEKHSVLCTKDISTNYSVHELMQYIASLKIHILNTSQCSENIRNLVQAYMSASDLSWVNRRPEMISEENIKKISAVVPQNLPRFIDVIGRFAPYTGIIATDSWWHEELSQPGFAEFIGSFADFISDKQNQATHIQEALLLQQAQRAFGNEAPDINRLAGIWKEFYRKIRTQPEFDENKLLRPWPELLNTVIELELLQPSFLRFFRPSYWRNRKAVMKWMLCHYPEYGRVKLKSEELSKLHKEAKSYMDTLAILTPCLNSPGLGIKQLSEDISGNMETARSLGALLNDCPPALYCAYHYVRSECRIPGYDPSQCSDDVLQLWRYRALQIWTEEHLKATGSRLQSSACFREEQLKETSDKLKELESDLMQMNRQKLRETLLKRGILSEPKPQPRARRTPVQKIVESIFEEASKKTRHKTLRCFVREYASKGLLDILPVWLLSPETMTVLFPREPVFDLIIVDEASQATVASSLPSLMRAKRWIIAGDDKQMPPSSFFASANKNAEDTLAEKQASDIFDSESLLTLARKRVVHKQLSWHYRSQHDALIAFSNFAFYDGALMTIPSADEECAEHHTPADDPERFLRWVQVENATYEAGVNTVEAARVARLMAESLSQKPDETVGVITFNTSQRDAVLDAIDALCSSDPSFAELYSAASQLPIDKRPFIKSIENVQGDERDSIFFSLGHCAVPRKGRTETELRVPARFGPLGQKGGERRLNVAISRARVRSTIVSSFLPEQLSVGNVKNIGPAYFKLFVEFMWAAAHDDIVGMNVKLKEARRLGESVRSKDLSESKIALPYDVSLAAQIATKAEKLGYHIEQDVGISQFKIPLVLQRGEEKPVAVLIEDDTNINAYDVLIHRPMMLAQKGWRVLSLNAVDWYNHGDEIFESLLSTPV